MGHAQRSRDAVHDVRKKVGEVAAAVLEEMRGEVRQLALQHRLLAKEIEDFRPTVHAAHSSAAAAKRFTEETHGAQRRALEAAEAATERARQVASAQTVDAMRLEELAGELRILGRAQALGDEMLLHELQQRERLAQQVSRLEGLGLWQRLRFALTGALPAWESDDDYPPTGITSSTDSTITSA